MTKTPIGLQDLRRRVYAEAKAEPSRSGFGWKRWSRRWLYDGLGLFREYIPGVQGPMEASEDSVSSMIGPITLGTK